VGFGDGDWDRGGAGALIWFEGGVLRYGFIAVCSDLTLILLSLSDDEFGVILMMPVMLWYAHG
jgi:hypothetical protein